MKSRYFWLWFIVCGIILLIRPAVGAAAPNKSLIAAGLNHTVAIQRDGSLWAWGDNSVGQLGLGDVADRNTPTRVGSASNWVAVAAGEFHSLGLKADGWGITTNKTSPSRLAFPRIGWPCPAEAGIAWGLKPAAPSMPGV